MVRFRITIRGCSRKKEDIKHLYATLCSYKRFVDHTKEHNVKIPSDMSLEIINI